MSTKMTNAATIPAPEFEREPDDKLVAKALERAGLTSKGTPDERVKLVYRIKIDVDNPDQELKANMPVDAEIVL